MNMKAFFKKITTVLAVAMMTVLLMPFQAAAATTSGDCGDGLTWTLSDNNAKLTITFSGTGSGAMKDYTIGNPAPWYTEYRGTIAEVVIGDGVTSIGWYAFAYCTSLTSITIPASVTDISSYAFYGCASLADIIVDTNNDDYTSKDGVLFNDDKTTLIQYPIGKTTTTYTIPDSVTSIGDNAFNACKKLTSITIPASVTSIGDYAFFNCTSLTSITIPASVTSIGEGAFSNCTGLTSITIPEGVTSIDGFVFSGCANLTSITVPASVMSIDGFAFYSCASLANVEFLGGNPPTLGEGAFWGVPSGLSVTVPVGKAAYYTTALSGKLPDGATIIEKSPDQIPDETDLLPPIPSEPSTPSIPPVVVPADTASGSTSGAKLEMKASQLPSGVEASDVTFVAKAVSAPAKFAAATLASIPNLPTAKSITVYDLDLLLKSSGEKVSFSGKVTVSIPMPAGYGSFLRVFHVANDGTMTEVPAVISGSNILLTLEHFSHYAVVDFASPAGKLPTKLTASAAVTTAATTAKPSEGGNNAGKNPTTGAMLPLLAILGCVGAGTLAVKARKRK